MLNSDAAAPANSVALERDLGPVAWVEAELRRSLEAAVKSLRRFLREAEQSGHSDLESLDAAALRGARQHFHQVAGAFAMVGLDPAGVMVRAMETVAQKLVMQPSLCTDETVGILERATFAIGEYLDASLAGKAVSAVGLFPQYAQVQALAGAERAHPADLWSAPSQMGRVEIPIGTVPLEYGPAARQRLDQAVLGIVKTGDRSGARQLTQLCPRFAAALEAGAQQEFWLICAAFFEAQFLGLLPADVHSKRAASRVLMQYSEFARGAATPNSRLLRELLFFCAYAVIPADVSAPSLERVRQAWGFGDSPSLDYDHRRFGRFDPVVLAQARKRISAAAETWSALAAGDRQKLKLAADQFGLVAESLQRLHPQSNPLADALNHALDATVRSGEIPPTALAMEVATSILYLQAAYEELDTPDETMSERAAVLAARLARAESSSTPEPLERWMEELYRRVSDRQTMGSVVEELRSTLHDAEQALDQYFRDAADTAPLVPVPGHLLQMRGVLSVLGLDQASHAVVRMRERVEQLLEGSIPDGQPRHGVFNSLAANLGALGFLIDMLGYQPTLARKLFIFDTEQDELRVIMGRAEPVPAAVVASQRTAPADARPGATDAVLLAPLASTPDQLPVSEARQEPAVDVSKHGPEDGFLPGPSSDDSGNGESSASTQPGSQAGFFSNHLPTVSSSEPAPAALPHSTADEEDAELREIFLEEAREVVANGHMSLRALAADPSDLSEQTSLRRAFHTLKGSSRMVQLFELGDAAWSMEQLFNAWLAEQKPLPETHSALASDALAAFGRWVDDIAEGQDGHWTAQPFQASSDALRLGHAPVALHQPEPEFVDTLVRDEAVADTDFLPTAGLSLYEEIDSTGISEQRPEPAPSDEFSGLELGDGLPPSANPVPDLDPARTSDMQIEELDFSEFSSAVEEQKTEAQDRPPADDPSSILPVEELAAIELALSDLQGSTVVAIAPTSVLGEPRQDGAEDPAALSLTEPHGDNAEADDMKVIGSLRIPIPLYNVYLNEADEWSRRLLTELQEWSLELHRPTPEPAIALAHSLGGSSATVGFHDLSRLARLLEHALSHVQLAGTVSVHQSGIFVDVAEDIRHLLHQFAAGFLREPTPRLLRALQAVIDSEPAPVPSAASFLRDPGDAGLKVPSRGSADRASSSDAQKTAVASEAPSVVSTSANEPPPVDLPLTSVAAAPELRQATTQRLTGSSHASFGDEIDTVDSIDPDLFPIFEEEALELLPALNAPLRQWANRPEDMDARGEVLRALHTLKGSARLAGALRLGELAHRFETEIEELGRDQVRSGDVEPLLGYADALRANLEQLRSQDQAEQAALAGPLEALTTDDGTSGTRDAADMSPSAIPAAEVPAAAFSAPATAASTGARKPVEVPVRAAIAPAIQRNSGVSVRVRSQLLDRLVNQAGEVMISRSRLEARLAQMQGSLVDLTGNLDRLRRQLRDIEVQAESQMQSRLALAKDTAAAFDPLEFDRFTRVQELTRMMAESVDDVATVQRNLQRSMQGSEDELVGQGRQARELQRDLLRTRMVEFESIADRLYAVARQAAKETGKPITLDITGGAIEMDRGVLERLAPAFEHLLRNAVAHGIEDAGKRAAAGKLPAGNIVIGVEQAGNDVVVEFRDDGAGLDFDRIREKARALGLPAADAGDDDPRLAELIFAPGFSTAAEVTELAGRGIGMDVVRSEVQATGGRIETESKTGSGTRFRLILPLTTAVTQVVMLRAGALVIGVPTTVVELVRRATSAELEQAYSSGSYSHDSQDVPFYWAGALLQSSARSFEPPTRTRPVIVLRSARQRIAVHVDEVLGQQEVVVKNLGPQLARLPGLSGMSVLPSGAVILIYNPVALANVFGERVRELVAQGRAAAANRTEPDGKMAGAAAALTSDGEHLVVSMGPSADADIPLIMVVDDSITVRRVTQRLLRREGYRVVLASDGLQALERLQEERPALVLSDIEMPRMDGFDLVRNIRADASLQGLPIVMITSRIAAKHREHAMALGANHYLGKPYPEEELLGLVRLYTATPVVDEAAEPASAP